MNSKHAKRLRREMRTIIAISPRETVYESHTWPNGHKTIRLAPGCGRYLYRVAKRQTVPRASDLVGRTYEFSGHPA